MPRRMMNISAVALLLFALSPGPAIARPISVEEQSIDQLQAAMGSGSASSVDLTRAFLARIAAMDRKGPTLRSIIALNPDALTQAKALDAERKAGRVRGPLHGVPC